MASMGVWHHLIEQWRLLNVGRADMKEKTCLEFAPPHVDPEQHVLCARESPPKCREMLFFMIFFFERKGKESESSGNRVLRANEMFRADHGQRTGEESQVDQQVEVIVDSGGGDGSVDDVFLFP